MNQSENYSDSEWAAFSPEQRDEVLRIEKSVGDFLADSRAIRYVESDANKTALLDFLEAHNPLAPVVAPPAPVPTQPPAPIPTAPTPRTPVAWRNGKAIAFTNPQRIGG